MTSRQRDAQQLINLNCAEVMTDASCPRRIQTNKKRPISPASSSPSNHLPPFLKRVVWHMLVAHEHPSERQSWKSLESRRQGMGQEPRAPGILHFGAAELAYYPSCSCGEGWVGPNQISVCLTKPVAALCTPLCREGASTGTWDNTAYHRAVMSLLAWAAVMSGAVAE